MPSFSSVEAMLSSLDPVAPVYCVHPRALNDAAKQFLAGFPGRVLYAVKANNEPTVIDSLYEAGIRHFDCASLAEIELITGRYPEATCYFMSPVRFPGDAQKAFRQHGLRHFMIDSIDALPHLLAEIDAGQCVIFARLAVSHESAVENLSSKFGAAVDDVPGMLAAIRSSGAEPALAFNVGSGVRDPVAFQHALTVAGGVLDRLPFPVRLVDIGGGFPRSYPGFEVPPLDEFFAVIREAKTCLPLADDGELLAEPGRALCATGLSTVARVLLRKPAAIYINDGMYGAFWELRFNGHKQHAIRVFRNGRILGGPVGDFTVFGPTCDSTDKLPALIALPRDIAVGDHIEFTCTGAYSLSGRTDFNGFRSEQIVTIVP